MIRKGKIQSTLFDSLKRRIVKAYLLGSSTETGYEALPYGFDSNPIQNKIAIYAKSKDQKEFIIGYINLNQLADVGESRMFSTDSKGNLKFHVWLHNDGTAEIGGTSDHMVRYSALETAFKELQDKFNAFAAAYIPGGPSSVGTPPVIEQSIGDITLARIDEIKTI